MAGNRKPVMVLVAMDGFDYAITAARRAAEVFAGGGLVVFALARGGLATLQKQHIRIGGAAVEFDFDAKSGHHRRCQAVDPEPEAIQLIRRAR